MSQYERIRVEYNGSYPNLCSGTLKVTIDDTCWVFPDHCLYSSGGIWFDDDWIEHVDSGPWTIDGWPEEFPEELKQDVVDAVNDNIPYGCCGGCV